MKAIMCFRLCDNHRKQDTHKIATLRKMTSNKDDGIKKSKIAKIYQ